MGITLYRKHNYTNKSITLIKDTLIREYDIKSAGLNIIYNKNFITKDEYDGLLAMDKLERNIIIGKWLISNSHVNAIMMDEFVEIRKEFMTVNNLDDDDILSIKKDAIFVLDKKLNNLNIGPYEFAEKKIFTSYLYMNRKEYYYNKYTDELIAKGFSQEIKDFQEDKYFKILKDLFKLSKDKNALFKYLIELKQNFVERELPMEYYKDMVSNEYLFKLSGMTTKLDNPPSSMVKYIHSENNLTFINNLISTFL